jgi:hypothetical protein
VCAPLALQLLLFVALVAEDVNVLPSRTDNLITLYAWIPSLVALIIMAVGSAALGRARTALDVVLVVLNATFGFIGLAWWSFLAWLIPQMGV